MTPQDFDKQQQFFHNTRAAVTVGVATIEELLLQMPWEYCNPKHLWEYVRLKTHTEEGRIVVNSRYALPGQYDWCASSLVGGGRFWSASPLEHDYVDYYYRHGAIVVELVSNEQIESMAMAIYNRRRALVPELCRLSWEEFVERYGMEEAVRSVDRKLPYRSD